MAKEKRKQITGLIDAKTKRVYEAAYKKSPREIYSTKNEWLDAVIEFGVKTLSEAGMPNGQNRA